LAKQFARYFFVRSAMSSPNAVASNPASWAYLAPIVIENGGWALFITTARGRNHAKSMLDMARTRDDWFSEVLPVNVTGAMAEEAVEQQRIEYAGSSARRQPTP
jgi:hypothetical protein